MDICHYCWTHLLKVQHFINEKIIYVNKKCVTKRTFFTFMFSPFLDTSPMVGRYFAVFFHTWYPKIGHFIYETLLLDIQKYWNMFVTNSYIFTTFMLNSYILDTIVLDWTFKQLLIHIVANKTMILHLWSYINEIFINENANMLRNTFLNIFFYQPFGVQRHF